jgi:fibrillarin-like pre-rRNA processing protein
MESRGLHSFKKIEGVYRLVREGTERLATLSQAPGTSVYGEEIVEIDGKQYRVWDPFRSKLAAAILKGLSKVPITDGDKILYLGAASGTTASHVSDIVGEEGRVYCVEFAQRSFRDLVTNGCRNRPNMTPIFQDARFPIRYRSIVQDVDTIYSDVAQPDQARIPAENIQTYLKDRGDFLMAVKARSVNVSRDPSAIYNQEKQVLESKGHRIAEMIRLDPFEMDHCMIRGSR